MRHGNVRPGTPSLRSRLLTASLCLCALAIGASEAPSAASTDANPPELEKTLQKLGYQIGQLRQTTVQTGRIQIEQGEGIQRQMGSIELQQSQLYTQLREINQHQLQQISALQSANDKLQTALWTLASMVVMLLWLILALWRTRRNWVHAQTDAAHPAPMAPTPAPTPMPTPSPVAPTPASSADPTPVATDAEATDLASTASPTAPHAAPWAHLVAADLNHTEQALNEARQGFMQPVSIDR